MNNPVLEMLLVGVGASLKRFPTKEDLKAWMTENDSGSRTIKINLTFGKESGLYEYAFIDIEEYRLMKEKNGQTYFIKA